MQSPTIFIVTLFLWTGPRTAEIVAVAFTAYGGWQFFSKNEMRILDIFGFKCEFGGGNRVRKKSVSMRKFKLRESNAENCVN